MKRVGYAAPDGRETSTISASVEGRIERTAPFISCADETTTSASTAPHRSPTSAPRCRSPRRTRRIAHARCARGARPGVKGQLAMSRPCAVSAQMTAMQMAITMIDHTGNPTSINRVGRDRHVRSAGFPAVHGGRTQVACRDLGPDRLLCDTVTDCGWGMRAASPYRTLFVTTSTAAHPAL
jgi:hypothetical protein